MMYTNMLLFSVNDILDFKLIEEGNFTQKIQTFTPKDTLQFVFDIIQQTSVNSEKLCYHVRTIDSLESELESHKYY